LKVDEAAIMAGGGNGREEVAVHTCASSMTRKAGWALGFVLMSNKRNRLFNPTPTPPPSRSIVETVGDIFKKE